MTSNLQSLAARAGGGRSRSAPRITWLVAVAVACATVAWAPGDAPFINDEPALLDIALQHNAAGGLASFSLHGSRGARYGPVAVWLYQGMLLVTHDILAIVVLRALTFMVVLAVALSWLARSAGLPRSWVPVLLVSPYLWFYARHLWDNSFCIPFSALTFAAYASFLARPRRLTLTLAIFIATACVIIHLMSLALVLPLFVHLVATQRAYLWKTRAVPLVPALVLVAVTGESWLALLEVSPTVARGVAHLDALWFATLGARFSTAGGLDYFFGDAWTQRFLGGPVTIAVVVSQMIGYGLCAWGMALAVGLARRALREGAPWSPRAHLAALSLGVWWTQTALNLATATSFHPHYYNATWICFLFFGWLGLERAFERGLGPYVVALHGSVLASALAIVAFGIHVTHGTRTLGYGIALREQLDLARRVARADPGTPIQTDIEQLRLYRHALAVLVQLRAPSPSADVPRRTFSVRFASSDPSDARIRIVEQP